MRGVTIGLAVVSVALGGVGIQLYKRLHEAQQRADAEAALRVKLESRVKELELASRESDSDIAAEVADAAVASSINPAAERIGAAAADPAAADVSQQANARQRPRGSNAYDTPQGREMMRLNGRIATKRLYGDLFKQLQIDSQQSEQLMNLLVDQQERQMQAYQKMRGDRAGRAQATKDMQVQAQAEIASLLGAQKAEAYAKYQATLGERIEAGQMAAQLDAFDMPISNDQKERLINVMAEEKASFPAPDVSRWDPESRAALSDWREQYNRRVMGRASTILSSEQYRQLSEIQETQLRGQRAFNEQQTEQRQQRNRRNASKN